MKQVVIKKTRVLSEGKRLGNKRKKKPAKKTQEPLQWKTETATNVSGPRASLPFS
jgi:hypothetical protein